MLNKLDRLLDNCFDSFNLLKYDQSQTMYLGLFLNGGRLFDEHFRKLA